MEPTFKIAQISDTHLFSDKNALHCGANVYSNLEKVLLHIQGFEKPDVIIFTGDLTQDHTEASYQQFVNLIQHNNIECPVHFIAGNHDKHQLLNSTLVGKPFHHSKIITKGDWQVLLINTKSESPAGYITDDTLLWLNAQIDIMMHHHPIDVGYFIDKHGLTNKSMFWEHINQYNSVQALACGHVHNALLLEPNDTGYLLPLYTCPATSIQFDKTAETSACNGQGAGYRVFELGNVGFGNSELSNSELGNAELSNKKALVTRTHFVNKLFIDELMIDKQAKDFYA